MASSSLNYISCLEDEIALEGLDGITLQALWVRLKQRPNFETCLQLDDHSKAFLWDLICGNEEIFMYELPTSREMLVIFNRYEHMDPELGIVLEPKDVPHDIYPFHPVDDEKNGVRGSCKLYYERVDITDSVVVKSLQQVEEEYGEKMVLVASQRLRDKALNVSTCIDKFYDLTLTQYILLERIGRSRQMGEITQGKVSLAAMGDNPKSMFYHRKRLLKLNLITKQPHQQKGCRGQTQNGSLLHLTRFYVERRSKFIMMIQRAVEILKSKPGNCAPYTVVKEEMGMPETSCRKLFKSLEFQRYIKNVNSPYRRIYPDASPSQWRCKGKDAERYIRIMELVNPGIDPQEVCKVDDIADDDEDEDSYPGILDQKKVVWKVGLLQQAYEIVEEAGPDGVSQSDMARFLGQAKLDSRTICRNLQRRNSVHSLMKDVGRQRVSRYVSNKYARTGHLTQEFRKEREKMMAMIEESRAQEAAPSTSQQDEVMKIVESNSMEGVEVDLEMVPYVTKKSEVQALCSPGGDATCGIAEEQKKQLPDEPPKKKNQGFLTMLEEIQLTYSNQKRNSPHVTTRMMKRANMIIENVRSIKVIDDAFKLQKMIVKAESEEGYPVKMDKKSLNRLLDRLARGGFLKNIIVKLKCGDNIKLVPFVVDPSITFESPHLKSAIEQQKLKFLAHKAEPKKESEGGLITSSREQKKANSDPDVPGHSKSDKKINVNPMDQTSVGASMQELKQMHQVTAKQELSISKEKSPEASTSEGPKKVLPSRASLGPKFVRMCELHKLLFYIVYGYCGHEDLDQEKAWEAISKSSPEAQLHDEDLSSYPTIFSPEISWKMFIPPLPNHMISETGWAFVCDILLRLPLCIFVRLVSINYISNDVEVLLQHPLKKNLLVKHLPPSVRQTLLQGRRYVTYVMDLINRLCYIGLVQYGHQVLKEKDQVFIYVNHRASLIDTTTSSPGYHQISADKEYVRKEYYFSCMQDVHQYWYDLWTISMHTPLGGHNCMQGKKITIQILDRKPQIMESIKPRATLEAPARDNGSIPGDGRGAGGLDSAMFAHLKRNWSSNSGHSAAARPSALVAPTADGGEKTYEGSMSYSQYLMNTTTPSSDTLSPKHRLAGLRNVKLSVYKPRMGTDGKTLEIPVGMVGEASKGRKRKREQSSVRDPLASKHSRVSSQKRIKPDSYQRDIKMRKRSPKKPYYDEEDRAALRRMNKLRVDWSSAEDSFLLLCKVASCFLFPNKRSQMITFSLVRDMLHKRFPEARNKTSRACQRRINYIMKNPTTEDNVAIFLEEVKQDPKIVQDFKGPRLPRNKKNIENIYANMFQSLMQRLVIKFGSSESRQCPDLPDTIEEFEERFRIIVASPSLRSKLRCREVQSVPDIDFYVVNALIYSSLCSKYDRDSYAYQLYLAYQQYPQSLLNSVLTHMRQDQMISYKKCYNRSLFTQTCLPLSTSPFQLSVTYLHVFNFKYQYEIFHQAWDMLKRMYDKEVTLLNKLIPSLKSQSKETTSIIKPASLEMSTVIADDKNPEDENDTSEKGVPVVILHEGGYCATIVALLATKRLIFDIVIPEQIIMMDQQQQPLLDDQPQSLLRRFSSHTEMSGRNISDPRDPLNETEQQFPSTESPVTFHILEDVNKEVSKKERNSVGSKDQNISEGMVSEEVMKGSRDFRRPGKRKAIGKDVMKVKKSKVKHEELEQVDVSHTATSLREIEASSLEIDMMHINQSVKSGKLIKCKPFDEGTLLKNDIEFEKVEVENAEDFSSQELGDSSQPGELSSTEGEDSEAAIASGRGNLPSASRLGLYMMRDQLSRAEVDQINIQHAQEHLVVNACDVTCRLRPPPELQESFEIVVPEKPELIENYLLPLTMQRVSECLEHRKKVILKEWSTLNEVLSLWKKEGKRETLLQLVKETYDYIHSCKELGASVWELKEKFSIPGVLNIMLVVNMMEEARLLLRVGVALVRWVTMPHTKPWLIHTNKITRYSRQNIRLQGVYRMNVSNESVSPAEKQQLGSNADSGEDCVKVDDQGGVKHHKMDIQLQDCQTQMSSDCTQDSHHSISSVVEDTTLPLGGSSSKESSASGTVNEREDMQKTSRTSQRIFNRNESKKESDSKEVTSTVRHIHSHLAMCKRKYKCDEEVSQEMERTIKHHESMDYEQISVAVRPWVRLDGTLNRRVLDRLLGAVLSLIMERPGISGRDIVCRFSPALQPAHTHDLLETLVQLECIIREELIQSHKVSLFSDTVEYNLVPADIHDCDDDLIYEPAVDAIIKMAMFIGDKKYSQDFLSGDSR